MQPVLVAHQQKLLILLHMLKFILESRCGNSFSCSVLLMRHSNIAQFQWVNPWLEIWLAENVTICVYPLCAPKFCGLAGQRSGECCLKPFWFLIYWLVMPQLFHLQPQICGSQPGASYRKMQNMCSFHFSRSFSSSTWTFCVWIDY